MHDGMPYDPIQGQGHECLKVTQEEGNVSSAWDYFLQRAAMLALQAL